MSKYPFIKLVVPTPLKAYKNGQLPANLLAKVKTGGQMYAPVAEQFNKMYKVQTVMQISNIFFQNRSICSSVFLFY